MTCDDARELFTALGDGALDAAEHAALEAHLAGCADCRREWERFRSTVALVRSLEPPRAPAGFVDRVVAAAYPVRWPRRLARALLLPWPIKVPLGAAAIILMGVAVSLVFRATPELQQAARLEQAPSPVAAPTPETPVKNDAARPETAPGKTLAEERPGGTAPSGAEHRVAVRDARENEPSQRSNESRSTAEAPAARPPAAAAPAAQTPPTTAPAAPTPPASPVPRQSAPREAESRLAARAEDKAAAPLGTERARREAVGRAPALAQAPADVSGRLAVADPEATAGALAALVTEVGGVVRSRSDDAAGPLFELAVPASRWADFTRGLASLGAWTPERQVATLPATVRVTLRLARP